MTSAPVMNALAVGKLLQQQERHKWRPEQASGRKGFLNVGIVLWERMTKNECKAVLSGRP